MSDKCNKIDVSIVIPLYNVQQYVRACLNSIASQDFSGTIECIVVDDCGTDDSLSVVESFISGYHGDIEYRVIHHEHNRGLSAARNTGIEASRGEFITFIDSDDYVSSRYVSELYECFVKYKDKLVPSIVSCCCCTDTDGVLKKFRWDFSENVIVRAGDFLEDMLLMKVPHMAWGKLFRREVFDNVRFREGRNNEDVLFALDVADEIRERGIPMIVIPSTLYFYRQRENSICRSGEHPFFVEEMDNLEDIMARIVNEEKSLQDSVRCMYFNRLVDLLLAIKNKDNRFHYRFEIDCKRLKGIEIKYMLSHLSIKRFLIVLAMRFVPSLFR